MMRTLASIGPGGNGTMTSMGLVGQALAGGWAMTVLLMTASQPAAKPT
jgi:hypothetical protein